MGLRLRAKLLAILGFLTLVSLVSAGFTYWEVEEQKQAQHLERAAQEATNTLEKINGLVFAVAMDSRGIYMSQDWTAASKFATPLLANLEQISDLFQRLEGKTSAIVSTPAADLAEKIKEFAVLRTNLVRLAREDTHAARAFGDNDPNRNNRKALGAALEAASQRYHEFYANCQLGVDVAHQRLQLALQATFGATLMAFCIGLFLVQLGFSRPISRLKANMLALSEGARGIAICGLDRRDEIGEMAATLRVFQANLQETERLKQASEQVERQTQETRKAELRALAQSFESAVGTVVDIVASASRELTTTAEHLAKSSSQADSQSRTVVTASEEASANVQTVAAAAEELSSSVRDISHQVDASSSNTSKAANETEVLSTELQALEKASEQIGGVIELISSIAEQTNLLALNATIEAARAGEAGKGFAVVAHEVKTLAVETAKATGHIEAQIEAIQASTRQSSASIGNISKTIKAVDTIACSIASAVKQQSSATEEITRSMEGAKFGTMEVSANTKRVQLAVAHSATAANSVLVSARELASQSEVLRTQVSKFVDQVKAA